MVKELVAAGIRVSLFVEPDEEALETAAADGRAGRGAAHRLLVRGALGRRDASAPTKEFKRLAAGARLAAQLGLEVHAGHGLDYASAETISALPEIVELNIGHYLIGEAIAVGLPDDHPR